MTRDATSDGGEPDGPTDAASLTYEIDPEESPSTAVARATALLTDTSILDLDPLYHAIDPAHLDGIVEEAGDEQPDASLSFAYEGCEVTVTPGEVRVETAEESAD